MIFIACLLTVLIETPFLALFGYRSKDELLIIICANVVTNLLLNLALAYVPVLSGAWVYLLEALVVAAEYAIYAAAFGPSRRLFLLTLLANCLSYGLGLIIF
jgi:hypothetical protein